MKRTIIFTILSLFLSVTIAAKDSEVTDTRYNRNSIYSVLIAHSEQKFAKEIESQFLNIPVPEKYNDHDLSIKVVHVDKKGKYDSDIDLFIEDNFIASRLIGKWFNRNILTGECSMDLIKERGVYNATELDRELASRSPRGIAMLQDAGEQLIGHTFLLMNEISYVDKSKTSGVFGGVLKIAGSIGGNFVPGLSNLTDLAGDAIQSIKGFKVKIHTRLYQLEWDDDIDNDFYTTYYSDEADDAKCQSFENNRKKFKLKYIGDVISKGGSTSFLGIKEEEPLLMVRKACQRALDENVVDLAKKYDVFRIKSPILSAENDEIRVSIGLKEGLNKDSRYEVLEMNEENGRIQYKRVAVIKPKSNKIWDNRFMASEEGAYGAEFGASTFEKVSGGDIYPGLLVREID